MDHSRLTEAAGEVGTVADRERAVDHDSTLSSTRSICSSDRISRDGNSRVFDALLEMSFGEDDKRNRIGTGLHPFLEVLELIISSRRDAALDIHEDSLY